MLNNKFIRSLHGVPSNTATKNSHLDEIVKILMFTGLILCMIFKILNKNSHFECWLKNDHFKKIKILKLLGIQPNYSESLIMSDPFENRSFPKTSFILEGWPIACSRKGK